MQKCYNCSCLGSFRFNAGKSMESLTIYCKIDYHIIPKILVGVSHFCNMHELNSTGCYASYQEVSRCHTRGEKAHKHPGFETQIRHHQKSKTGISMAPQKKLVSFKFFLKNLGGNTYSDNNEISKLEMLPTITFSQFSIHQLEVRSCSFHPQGVTGHNLG